MSAPTCTITASVTAINGIAPTSGQTFTWWVAGPFGEVASAWSSSNIEGRVTPQVVSTGTGVVTLTLGSTEVEELRQGTAASRGGFYGTAVPQGPGQGPPGGFPVGYGVYGKTDGTDPWAIFATLVLNIPYPVVNNSTVYSVTGTFAAPIGTTPVAFTAEMVGPRLGLLLGWQDANGFFCSPSASGARAIARTWAMHAQAMRDKIYSIVGPAFTPPQRFPVSTVWEPYDHDLATFRRGFEAMRRMGINSPALYNGDPYTSWTTRHRQAALDAGLPSFASMYQTRSPGGGFAYKKYIYPPEYNDDAGLTAWANRLRGYVTGAGYAPGDLKRLVMADEQAWQTPWELDIINTGTFTPQYGTPESADDGTGSVSGGMAKAQAAFQAYLQSLKDEQGNAVTPAYFGLSSWSNAVALGPSKLDGTIQQRRLYCATTDFILFHLSQTFGMQYQKLVTAFGSYLAAGSDWNFYVGRSMAPGTLFNSSPDSPDAAQNGFDWFMFGRFGNGVFSGIDGWFGDYFVFMWSNYFSRMRSKGNMAGLIVPFYGVRVDGATQAMIAQAGQGAKQFDIYYLGPEPAHTGETFSENLFYEPQGITAIANGTKLLAQTEDLLFPGQYLGGNKVAILYSRHSQKFDDFRGTSLLDDGAQPDIYAYTVDWMVDQMGLYEALQHMNVPVDWLDEEDCIDGTILGNYSVIYVTGPNVPERAQVNLGAWAQTAGHVLVTSCGAGAKNRHNDPLSAGVSSLNALGGITESAHTRQGIPNVYSIGLSGGAALPGRFINVVDVSDSTRRMLMVGNAAGATDFRTTVTGVPSGNILATFDADGSTAIVDVPVGSGRHIHFAFFPGINYILHHDLASSQQLPVFNDARTPYARDFIVGRALAHTTYKRAVEPDTQMVEAQVLTSSGGWAICICNWTGTARTVNFRIRPPFVPTSSVITKPDGSTIPMTLTGDGYTFTMPLDATGTILRLYGSGGAPPPPPVSVESWGALPI